jgi:hypothetical protein
MVVNFRARRISRGARKLIRTPTLNKKKKFEYILWKGIHMFNFRYSVKDIFIKGLVICGPS